MADFTFGIDATGRNIGDMLAAVKLADAVAGLAINAAAVDYIDGCRLSSSKTAGRGAPSSRFLWVDADGADVVLRGEDKTKRGAANDADARGFWNGDDGEARPIVVARFSGDDAADRAELAAAQCGAFYSHDDASDDDGDAVDDGLTARLSALGADALRIVTAVGLATGKSRTNSGGGSYADHVAKVSKAQTKRKAAARKSAAALSVDDLLAALVAKGAAADMAAARSMVAAAAGVGSDDDAADAQHDDGEELLDGDDDAQHDDDDAAALELAAMIAGDDDAAGVSRGATF